MTSRALKTFFALCVGHANPGAKTPPEMASVAPHVRGANSAARVERWRVFGLVVVLVAALFNVGQQYFFFLYAEKPELRGWREALIDAWGMKTAEGYDLFFIAGAVHVLPILAVAYLTGLFWESLFAAVRGRNRQPGLLATALVFTALMPPAAPLWHIALGMSFATVFAQEVFGGHGKTFLPSALAGAAVLQVSFPSAMATHPIWQLMSGYTGTTAFSLFAGGGHEALVGAGIDAYGALLGNVQSTIGTSGVLAAVIGGLVLLWVGAANWRAPAGVVVGVIAATALTGGGPNGLELGWHWHLLLGGATFSAFFLATDPAGSAATQAGRWGHGILAGAMVVLIRVYNPGHPDGIVPAFLFAAILAPMIDAFAVRLQIRRAQTRARKRRAAL